MGQWGFPPSGHIQAVVTVLGVKMEGSVNSNQIPFSYYYCHYHHYLQWDSMRCESCELPVENSVMSSFCGYIGLN